MTRARNILKKWFDKHCPKIPPLTTAALATVALIAAGCGSSQTTSTTKPAQPSQQQIQQQQQQRQHQLDQHIATIVGDWFAMTTAMNPIANNITTATEAEWSALVGKVQQLKIDLGQLRPHLNAEQQAQLDGYLPTLTDLQDGARAGAVGDFITSGERWTGVAPQIRELGKLIVSLENESGGNA